MCEVIVLCTVNCCIPKVHTFVSKEGNVFIWSQAKCEVLGPCPSGKHVNGISQMKATTPHSGLRSLLNSSTCAVLLDWLAEAAET